MNRRHFLQGILAALALGTTGTRAWAASYPQRPVKIIATYNPGGTNDIMARLAARIWSDHFGQSFIVENRPGAAGILGTELVARAKPDGYTLLAGTFGPIVTAPTLQADLSYDPLKAFAPVGILSTVPNVIVVHPDFPAKTLDELIAFGKTSTKPIKFGLVQGGTPQFLSASLKETTGIKLLDVYYKGGAPALQDLIGNHIDLYIDNVPLVLPQIKAGAVRALAVAAPERSPALPDVPSTTELGYPEAVISAWHGILAPSGTPPAIVRELNAVLVNALRTAEITRQIEDQGGVVVANTPEEFKAFLEDEVPRWARVIKGAGFAGTP